MHKYTVISIAFVVLVLVCPLAVSLSLSAAFLAVVFPQSIAFKLFLKQRAQQVNPLSLWVIKFSLTILLLAVALRVLHENALLAAPYFISGVVAAVFLNIIWSSRVAHQYSQGE